MGVTLKYPNSSQANLVCFVICFEKFKFNRSINKFHFVLYDLFSKNNIQYVQIYFSYMCYTKNMNEAFLFEHYTLIYVPLKMKVFIHIYINWEHASAIFLYLYYWCMKELYWFLRVLFKNMNKKFKRDNQRNSINILFEAELSNNLNVMGILNAIKKIKISLMKAL